MKVNIICFYKYISHILPVSLKFVICMVLLEVTIKNLWFISNCQCSNMVFKSSHRDAMTWALFTKRWSLNKLNKGQRMSSSDHARASLDSFVGTHAVPCVLEGVPKVVRHLLKPVKHGYFWFTLFEMTPKQ